MRVLSLFSGIGGLDLGLERAGMTIAGQVEIDPWCRKVLAKHWPEVPRHDDVRTCVQWWGGRAADLVAGGFPCQPVSSAGKRRAQADSRWLWPAFADVIRHLGPRYVLVENVPGLLVRGMGDVLGDLAALGYDAEWDCVPAAFVGAPHIRNRVWIVAYPQSGRCRTLWTHNAAEARADASPRSAGEQSVLLADSDDDQPDERQGEVRATDQRPVPGWGSLGPGGLGAALADSTVAERRIPKPQDLAQTRRRAAEPRERRSQVRPGGDWWATEPDVGRVADGIPARVDRLRGLGNAVVPQVAEHIGRLIMEAS